MLAVYFQSMEGTRINAFAALAAKLSVELVLAACNAVNAVWAGVNAFAAPRTKRGEKQKAFVTFDSFLVVPPRTMEGTAL